MAKVNKPVLGRQIKDDEADVLKQASDTPVSMATLIDNNRECCRKYGKRFKEIFKVPIGAFMHPVTGFDICGFDNKVIRSKDGVSMRQTLVDEYGLEAAQMIAEIIKYPKF